MMDAHLSRMVLLTGLLLDRRTGAAGVASLGAARSTDVRRAGEGRRTAEPPRGKGRRRRARSPKTGCPATGHYRRFCLSKPPCTSTHRRFFRERQAGSNGRRAARAGGGPHPRCGRARHTEGAEERGRTDSGTGRRASKPATMTKQRAGLTGQTTEERGPGGTGAPGRRRGGKPGHSQRTLGEVGGRSFGADPHHPIAGVAGNTQRPV